MNKQVIVIKETESGLNQNFKDLNTGRELTRGEFADKIEAGKYPGYHVEHIKRGNQEIRVPRSNPDNSENNNLG